jgi:hypothetical protein
VALPASLTLLARDKRSSLFVLLARGNDERFITLTVGPFVCISIALKTQFKPSQEKVQNTNDK